MRRTSVLFIVLIIVLSIVLGACTSQQPPENVDTEQEGQNQQEAEPEGEDEPEADEEEEIDELTESLKGKGEGMIHVNQIGYRPDAQKLAVINSQGGKFRTFEVINEETGEVVLTGETYGKTVMPGRAPEPKLDLATMDKVLYADFSEVKEPGTYYISIPDYGRSFSFRIAENVYNEVKDALLKAMYYQRCGMALEEKYAGVWKHDACHLEDAILWEDQSVKIDVTGGWHDAGDFGRYTVPAAKSIADLLLAYQFFPTAFSGDINIPESGNGVPDILDEARYALDWMLKMQDPVSGGVYHKVTTKQFPGTIMPERDKDKLYVLPISPTATGDFAGVMALASRIYEPYDKEFSQKALAAAEKAWEWLVANGTASGFKNPQGVGTGEYGDSNSIDERYWAAVELYLATGNEKYHTSVKSLYGRVNKFGMGWGEVSGYGTISYLFADPSKVDEAIYKNLKDGLIAQADNYVKTGQNDGYRVPFGTGDYGWGSNGSMANRGMILLVANELQPNEEYVQAAEDILHYLFGRNALDQSYVTGFGSKPLMNPHHRPSQADGIKDPVPGLLSGGPNKNREDPTAKKLLPENGPAARAFVDHEGSWSTNEITTYWNSPAVFVAGYFTQK